jgi:hypothetical protein
MSRKFSKLLQPQQKFAVVGRIKENPPYAELCLVFMENATLTVNASDEPCASAERVETRGAGLVAE